jgi:hypothetical protein
VPLAKPNSNRPPRCEWRTCPVFTSAEYKTQRLYVNGEKTPYFVTSSSVLAHYTQGKRHGLWMHLGGCAANLGCGSLLTPLKHRAEQMAMREAA